MNPIDLSLAVNYIPACSCLVRLMFYLLCLSILSNYEDSRTYIVLAIMVYLDRWFTRGHHTTVFDTNSVLLTVFFAHVYQHVRRISDDVFFPVLLVYFLWAVFAIVCLVDSQRVTQALLAVHIKVNTLGVLVVSGVLLFLLYYTGANEPYGCVILKSMGFTVCCISWIYLVGIGHSNDIMMSGMYIIRFLPILILPIWMAIIFSVVVVGCLVYLFRKRYQPKYSSLFMGNSCNNGGGGYHGGDSTVVKSMEKIEEESDSQCKMDERITVHADDPNVEDLQRMFQLARQKNSM
jgi:hypothetical protein